MISWLSLGKVGLSSLLAALPFLRRGKSERDAGENPHSVPASLADPLLDDALKRLGAISHDDSVWVLFKTGVGAAFVRPDHFSRPHISEWLSRPEVSVAVKNLAQAQLASAPESPKDHDVLVSAYMDISGEHQSYAESYVFAAVKFLKASIQGAVKDSAAAAITQAGFRSVHDRIDEQDSKLNVLISSQALITSGTIAEHHGDDAKAVLDAILRRRASPGQNALAELLDLECSLGNAGKFAAAPLAIKAKVYDWIARLAASKGQLEEAGKSIAKLEEMGYPASNSALAWEEAARGNVDVALRRLSSDNSDIGKGNIFGILRVKKSGEDALAYLDAQENITPDFFTAVGWMNVVSCLAEKGRIEQATSFLSSLPDSMYLECPVLGYVRGMVYVANSVSEDMRARVIHEEYVEACDHLLDGDEADGWRAKAHDSFVACHKQAEDLDDKMLAERSKSWLQWLRLVDPARREVELATLVTEMNDGRVAVNLMQLAHAFNVKFNSSALTKYLERAEMLGGLSPQELNAKILLLEHLGLFPELASFIVVNWGRLAEVVQVGALGGMLIQAYVRAKECGRAEETLETMLAELHPLDVPRFKLMIEHCRGNDPTRQARENYEASGAIEDLSNLVKSLEVVRRWTELEPYALKLFKREPNSRNALRYIECLQRAKASDEDIVGFLNDWPSLVDREAELVSARAWALYHLGKVDESHVLNERLLAQRHNVNDIGLDINLAVRMGDWERLPAILNREWSRRNELPVSLLLNLAKLTLSSSRVPALQLVQECAARESDNPHSLLQAYTVAAAMGKDDIAMPLIHKAAQLSKGENALIKSFSFREMVELMKDSASDWRSKNDMFRSGSIPILWAAHILNVPLSKLLIAIPRENKYQADARHRQPIPIMAGNRHSIEPSSAKRLALDVTSIFILSELGFLERLFYLLDETLLSPRVMEMLLFEEEKVRFHQPSRIAEAKPLLELHRKGLLALAVADGPPELAREVGEEEATLLSSAKLAGGLCIHSGKLYRSGSYMDEDAQLGVFEKYLASPAVVARALHNEGVITAGNRDIALKYLEQVSAGETIDSNLAAGAPVFLDRVSTQYLSNAGILSNLVHSGRKVYVHPGAIEEWQALVDTEPYSAAMVEALEKIRRILKEAMAKGKVHFLSEGRKEENEVQFGISELLMRDLMEDVSQIDAACIDDRFLNSLRILEDRNGRKVDLLCSLDVIDMLVARGVASQVEREEAIHQMREWCLCMLPVDARELFKLLLERKAGENGALLESAQLRVIREYLARLHSSDFLCAPSDLEYMDGLWRTGQFVIRQLWADDKSKIDDIIARANWVVDNIIPDIELALRFAPEGKERMEEIALIRLVSALSPAAITAERKASYADWLERKIIAPYLPACSDLIDKAAKQIGASAIVHSVEVANEVRKLGGEGTDQDDASGARSEATE
jgi:tetratricopeptide (TPR) repeat protein